MDWSWIFHRHWSCNHIYANHFHLLYNNLERGNKYVAKVLVLKIGIWNCISLFLSLVQAKLEQLIDDQR